VRKIHLSINPFKYKSAIVMRSGRHLKAKCNLIVVIKSVRQTGTLRILIDIRHRIRRTNLGRSRVWMTAGRFTRNESDRPDSPRRPNWFRRLSCLGHCKDGATSTRPDVIPYRWSRCSTQAPNISQIDRDRLAQLVHYDQTYFK